MLSFADFINSALQGNGAQNDTHNVWVDVDGEQYTVSIDEVIDREESHPFEASEMLEADTEHPAWETLYQQYQEATQF